jgi:tetratricopeptide (TPR) repeat protein
MRRVFTVAVTGKRQAGGAKPPAPSPAPVEGRERRLAFCLGATLAVLAALAYLPVLRAGFLNLDDGKWVTANPHVNTGLSWANVKWAFASFYASNYVPLTWISHAVDCQLYGLAAGGHHLTNLLLHVANTLLFFRFVRRCGASAVAGTIAAGFFGLHPIHVESVAWVAERKDVLSTCFWLLACHAYLGCAAAPSVWRYLLVCAYFVLGLLAKPMLVTLPFVFLLLDVWPLRRLSFAPAPDRSADIPVRASTQSPPVVQDSKRAPPSEPSFGQKFPRLAPLVEKVPLLAITLLACFVTYAAQHTGGAVTEFTRYPLLLRTGNAAMACVTYLGKLVWPVGFPVFEPLAVRPFFSAPVLGAVLLLIALTTASLSQIRRRPYLTVGWLWYLGALVPVIGLVQVGAQGLAYRYTYIPFLGIYLAISQVPASLPRARFRPRALALGGAALLLALAALTWRLSGRWHDNESLYRYSLAHTRRNWLLLGNLASHLAVNQRFEEAIPLARQSLEIDPAHYPAGVTLAYCLEHTGRQAEAIAAYRNLLLLRPSDPSNFENLITVLIHENRLPQAEQVADQLCKLDPDRAGSHISRGAIRLAEERADEAIKGFERARELEPANDTATYYLGMARHQAGQNEAALQLLERPLNLNETQRINRFLTLGATYRDLRQFDKSAQVLRAGLQSFPNRIEILEQLAHVEYTDLKDYTNALVHLPLLLKLNPNHPQRATYEAAIKYLATQVPNATTNPFPRR